MTRLVPSALAISIIFASVCQAVEPKPGGFRVIDVPTEVKKSASGKFKSSYGMFEITMPTCFAFESFAEEEGKPVDKAGAIDAQRQESCTAQEGIQSIFISIQNRKPKSLKYCPSVRIGDAKGTVASTLSTIAGREACISVGPRKATSERTELLAWDFQTSCPSKTFTVTIMTKPNDSLLEKMKASKKPEVPAELQKVIDSIHCIEK